jgi:CRP-like cAMP-binding protein
MRTGSGDRGIGVDIQDRIDTERLILEFDITNEELANAANITLYTASRILSEWQRTGAISKRRGRIVVRSTERLFRRVA